MSSFLLIALGLTLATAGLLALPLLRNGIAPAPGAALAVALGLPALTTVLYLAGSNYDWQAAARATAGAADTAADGRQALSMEAAIARLEERLRGEPDNLDGWLLLGNAYLQTGRLADAEQAYARALALSGGSSAPAKLGLAEAQVLQNRDALAGAAGRLVEEALAELPDDPRALWYGGIAALARQDLDAVQARWSRLLALDPPDNVARVVREQLQALGLENAAAPVSGGQGTPALAPSGGTRIAVTVSVAEQLADRVPPNGVLFLAARDAQRPGPPLAALRVPVAGWPRALVLSDANAMLAGRKLSDASELRLVARISASGNALPQPGDIYGEARWRAGDGPRHIEMDSIVSSEGP